MIDESANLKEKIDLFLYTLNFQDLIRILESYSEKANM